MSAEYSVKELRKMAKRGDSFRPSDTRGNVATAYADLLERIKADEGAAAIWQYRRTSDAQWLDCDELDADAWKQTGLHEVRKVFIHPAAQAAQVEAEDMDAQLTVMIEHLTSIMESQAAEPVAQEGEE